jgi:transcriptional regulator with XRE-family HTH domain
VSLADRIREARTERLSYSQTELAQAIGLKHSQSVSNWERGISEPLPKHLRAIADVAGVPVAWFYNGDEEAAA